MKHAEIIVADIGSTITKVSAFSGLSAGRNACFLGQGLGLTTVAEGDVAQGLEAARKDLETLGGEYTGCTADGGVIGRRRFADDRARTNP